MADATQNVSQAVTEAAQAAGATVAAVTENAIAHIEGQVEAAEARTAAAEAAVEVLTDAAMRDALGQRMSKMEAEVEEWQNELEDAMEALETTVARCLSTLQAMELKMAEKPLVVLPAAAPSSSEAPIPPTSETEVAAVEAVPDLPTITVASPAVIVENPAAAAKPRRRWT